MGITAYLPDRDPEFISSWKGFRAFQDAMEALGDEKFPMIIDQLPDGDEGETSAEKAAIMLRELDVFEAEQSNITQPVLVDTERGIDVSMGSNVLGGALTLDRETGFDLGFDEKGFFVRDRWELNRELFRAMRVEQELLHPETHQVEYRDRDGDRTFICSTPFGTITTGDDGVPRMALRHFHIELRPSGEQRFAYLTVPLRSVLEASIASGNAIRWG